MIESKCTSLNLKCNVSLLTVPFFFSHDLGNILAFDLGFVVDGSKDIDDQGPGNFRKCLEFTKEILRSFPVSTHGVHTGLITYDRNAHVNINFDTPLDQSGIETAVDAIPYLGDESYTGNALDTAMRKLFPHSGREKVAHMLVLITGSNSQDEVESSAEELRASGIRIFCIGVGRRYDQSQLDLIASSPSDTYVITTEFETLRNVVPLLSSRIISGKMLPPSPNCYNDANDVSYQDIKDIIAFRKKKKSKSEILLISRMCISTK